jgi:catechol 2,3-dioxygenase-like lactoylglutathione lyase family enzyme
MAMGSTPDGVIDSESTMQEETTPPHLGNIAFWVSNFDAMRDFYSRIIGIPEIAAGDDGSPYVFYSYGPFSFSLIGSGATPQESGWSRCPMTPNEGDNWLPYITFYVPDLHEVILRGRESGVRFRTEKPFSLGEGFGWSIDVRDPDGNTVALTQR